MKKKLVLTAAAVALVGTLAVGGTLAWFTDVETATNVVTMGKVDVKLNEDGGDKGVITEDGLEYSRLVPGDTIPKTVTIENLEEAAYVRAIITIGESPAVKAALNGEKSIIFKNGEEKLEWVFTDGVAIVDLGEMKADGDIKTLFTGFEIPQAWGNEFAKEKFTIKVDVEAIQAEHVNKSDAWNEFEKVESPDLKNADGKSGLDVEGTIDGVKPIEEPVE